MYKEDLIYLTKQIHFLSIISVFLSCVSGLGLVFAIPCFTYAYYIKLNFLSYNEELIIKSMFYSSISVIMSIISLLIFRSFIVG